ncbi:MAG: OmpA family protein [Pseudomonadota bacterium]
MNKRYSITVLAFLLISVVSTTSWSQRPDRQGSQDYPLVSRFQGFAIDKYEEIQFDRYALPLGPAIDRQTFGEALNLEGAITKIHYAFPQPPIPSLYQLYKSYEGVFQADDVEVLFSCFEDECGERDKDLVRSAADQRVLLNGFMAFGDHAYQAVKMNAGGQDIYVALYLKQERDNVAYELHFIEVESMSTENITLADIQEGMTSTGKQAFYGLYFDTGESTLKDSSETELQLLADYLGDNTDTEYFIVGHTDNDGSYQSNLTLSFARAQSVVKALQDQYGLDVSKLTPIGIGPVSPVAANLTQDGKAQNRRVELVLK